MITSCRCRLCGVLFVVRCDDETGEPLDDRCVDCTDEFDRWLDSVR